jgi:hypothetical protein
MQTLPKLYNIKEEVYRKMLDGISNTIRVSAPGVIQSFNPTTQTAIIQLSTKEKINLNGNLSWEQIPLLVDVPVLFPRAGGFSITFPVQAGNECLVIFGDNCIDGFWQSGGTDNIQLDKRRHDLSDGMAIITGISQPNKLSGVSTSSMQIRSDDGSTVIDVKEGILTMTATTVNINSTNLNINTTNYSMSAQNSNSNANGNTTIDGRKFLTHEHSGVQTGGSSTGGVV